MDFLTCVLLNAPPVFLSMLVNTFYIFCLLRPCGSRYRIKQPLWMLLMNLVSCSLSYQMSLVVMAILDLVGYHQIYSFVFLVSLCSLYTSMASSVWLNFYYYTQIVPAQRALFLWVKKNIKSLIYSLWFMDRFYTTVGFLIMLAELPIFEFKNVTSNHTADPLKQTLVSASSLLGGIEDLTLVVAVLIKSHFFFSLVVMAMSSGATSAYLCKHLRRMMAMGRPLLSPHFKGHVRVTVSGLAQGALYMVCAIWIGFNFRITHSFVIFNNIYTHYTIVMLYTTCTTVTLGLGQAVFRQRAAHIWSSLAKAWREPAGRV